MIKIEIEELEYTFPTKWNEVTLDRFQAINEVKSTEKLEMTVDIISALTDIPVNKLEDLPYCEFNKIVEHCKFVFDSSNKDPLLYEINIEGKKYVMAKDLMRISTGEFIDLDTLIKDKENVIQNLHIIMAILFRPVMKGGLPEKYNVESIEERAELFRTKMTCNYLFSTMAFSSALGQALLEHTLDSLEKQEVVTLPKKLKKEKI